MITLSNKDRKILHDGINKQFDIWQKAEQYMSTDINMTRNALLKMVDKKKIPEFWKLDSEDQWDILCAFYSLYHSDISKESKFYNDSDIAKVNKKVTGSSMESTIENVNIAWSDAE